MKINEENFIQQLRKKNEKALDYVIDNYEWIIKYIVRKHLYKIMVNIK
nr:DNA replication protein [Clostridium sp. C2-6-12]